MKFRLPFAWILFHCAVLLAFLISLAVSPKIKFATSLFEILPPSSSLREVQSADSALASKTSRAVTILVKSESFEKAKSAAEKLYSRYVDSDFDSNSVNPAFFDSLSLYVDSGSVTEITNWLHEYRFALLDDDSVALLNSGKAKILADDAVSSIYSAFTLSDLENLSEDPFLLSEKKLRSILEGGAVSGTAMSPRDDVLACEKDGFWYVLLRGVISEKGAALASKKSTVQNLFDACGEIQEEILRDAQNDGGKAQTDRTEAQNDGSNAQAETHRFHHAEFIFSGVPFHSHESSSSAQKQISVISSVSLALIFFVFLWIFRSLVPAIVSALAVAFSCGVGFVSVLLFFRGIHVLTFVFGTTLIGTCLDYSIHYFVNWKANLLCDSGEKVRNHIFRGITLGFVSTEICFAALFLAPFPLLKQVSVFLFTGLFTAYFSVVALYPLIPMPLSRSLFQKSCPKLPFSRSLSFPGFCPKISRRIFRFIPLFLVVFSIFVIFANHHSLKIQNNIQELYSMSQKMRENEAISAKVLNTGSSGWYFILKSDSAENLIQKNEEFDAILSEAVRTQKIGNFLSVSQFVPSEKKQSLSFNVAANFLPIVHEQYKALGFDENPSDFADLAGQYEKNYRSLENHFVHPDDKNLPASIKDAISNLWIGEVDGEFYSCVLPLHAASGSEAFFREFAEQTEGIYFVNKARDISGQLDILSKTMLRVLAAAFVVVILILFFCYKARVVLKIAAVPLIVTLVTASVLLLCKISLSFFPITALVLVFGLGLDYIIYAVEGSEGEDNKKMGEAFKELGQQTNGSSDFSHQIHSFAILLSFVTTALSFGALAFSDFPPVHMLGLTVFAGLSAAVVTALSITKN